MIKTTFKAHPAMLFSLMKPFLFVLVLPLIRALIQYITTKQIDGLLTLEIIAFAIILIIAVLRYRAISITIEKGQLTVKKGIVLRRQAVIELSRLSSICLKQNLLDFIFGCVECAINTEAGRPKKNDFAFKMSKNDAKLLLKRVYGDSKREIIRFSPTKIALLAATTSSAFSGMIIGVPVINQLGDLLGIALSDLFLNEINNISSRLSTIFPPIVNTISLILLGGYMISFVAAFLKNINFKLQSNKRTVEIKSGLIVRKHIVFKKSDINNICIEQTPLMLLFKRFSMRVSIGGYGDTKGEKSVVIPVATYKGLHDELVNHFPQYAFGDDYIETPKSSLTRNRFFFMPTLLFVLIVAASITTAVIFEHFESFILFLTTILLAINLYYAYVCYRNYKFSRLSLKKGVYASGMVGFNMRELYCDKNNIGIVKIIQSPADIRCKTCKVKLVVRSENADSVKVKILDTKKVIDLLKDSFDLKNISI